MIDTLEVPPVDVSTTAASLKSCLDAYHHDYQADAKSGQSDFFCRRAGALAYRLAMPSTETLADIRALIACVAQGINLQVFEGRESTQLLYAAQVALAASRPPRIEKTKPATPDPTKI